MAVHALALLFQYYIFLHVAIHETLVT
jgi:hypothetical protein